MKTLISGMLLMSLSAFANANVAPWLKAIGVVAQQEQKTVEAVASVKVSDGLEYEVHTIFVDLERTMMRRTENDVSTVMAVEGFVSWAHNGSRYQELESKFADFIRGHQYHALLLHFEQFAPLNIVHQQDESCGCWIYRGEDAAGNIFTMFLGEDERPVRLKVDYPEFGTVEAELDDWQKVEGISFPMQIRIQDEDRLFTYRYTDVSLRDQRLFRAYLPPTGILEDRAAIYRLHRDMIDAHLVSDESLMHHIWSDEITGVSRGSVARMSGKDSAELMRASLAIREHSEYRDMVPPVIRVSDDGTLAWIAVSVSAAGVANVDGQEPRSFEFVSAWIATFSKESGQWRLTANASSFK